MERGSRQGSGFGIRFAVAGTLRFRTHFTTGTSFAFPGTSDLEAPASVAEMRGRRQWTGVGTIATTRPGSVWTRVPEGV